MIGGYHIKQHRLKCLMHTMTLSTPGKKKKEFLDQQMLLFLYTIFICLFWVVLIWAVGLLLSRNFSQSQHLDLLPILLCTKMIWKFSSICGDLDMKGCIGGR